MNENDFARAVSRYLENRLSPSEKRELLAAIDADPALRARFIDHVRVSVRLEASFHAADDPRLLERTKALLNAKDRGPRTVGAVQRRIQGRARTRAWIVGAVAAALLVAAVLVALPTSRPVPAEGRPEVGVRPEPRTPRPEPPPAPTVEKPPPPPVEIPKEKPEPVVVPPEKPKPESVPPPEAPPPPATPPKPAPPPAETKVAAARVESISGEAFRTGRQPLRAGDVLLPGEGLQTGPSAKLAISFADKTRIELEANTVVRGLADQGGKRFLLDRGTLRAQVAKQPAGQPMEVTTPHGLARVVGTTLSLIVNDATRLEVSEGKVQLERSGDGKTVEVAAGEYARIAPQTELVSYAKPQFIDLDGFGTGALCKPADGPVKKIYRDESLGATGGTCIAAPGVGTSLEGLLTLAPGPWHLWVRYRDTDQGPVSFQVLIDGRLAGSIAGEGFLNKPFEKWNWRRVSFETKGKAPRLTLRSMSEAAGYDRNDRTYLVVNRWDSLVLTRDPVFDPDKDLPEKKP